MPVWGCKDVNSNVTILVNIGGKIMLKAMFQHKTPYSSGAGCDPCIDCPRFFMVARFDFSEKEVSAKDAARINRFLVGKRC